MYFPKSAAVVLLQQRSYANNVVNKYFEKMPISKKQVMNNDKFINHLEKYYSEIVKNYAKDIIENLDDNDSVNSVLDIGCGLGLIDLSLYNLCKNKPVLYLLDGSPDKIYDDKLRIAKKG